MDSGILGPLPESTEISEGVHALVQGIFDGHALDGMIRDGREAKSQKNALNNSFYRKEFQTDSLELYQPQVRLYCVI